jgi:hypothetical protein
LVGSSSAPQFAQRSGNVQEAADDETTLTGFSFTASLYVRQPQWQSVHGGDGAALVFGTPRGYSAGMTPVRNDRGV